MGKNLGITRRLLKKNLTLPKIGIMLIYLCMVIFPYIRPIVYTAKVHSWSLSPYSFVFLTNDLLAYRFILSGILIVFADSFFLPWEKSKTGLKSIIFGNILYILIVALIYTIIVSIISILCMLPVIKISVDWELGWKMLAYSHLNEYPSLLSLSLPLIKNYSAAEAFVLSMFLTWRFIFFVGLVSYLFSIIAPTYGRAYLIVTILILDVSLYNMFPPHIVKYAPMSLSMLSTYNNETATYGITFQYSDAYFFIIFILLTVLCAIFSRLSSSTIRTIFAKVKEEE